MVLETTFVSRRTFTQEEFWEWLQERPPADINHYELIDGRIVMSPPAGWPHGDVETNISAPLKLFVRQHRLGKVLGSSAGYDLPSGDTVEPDISFISQERLEAGPAPVYGRFLKLVPNLVVEILSPSNWHSDLESKKRIYERNGVEEYWIVDPEQRKVEVFTLGSQGFELAGSYRESGIVHSPLLTGFTLSIEEIFE